MSAAGSAARRALAAAAADVTWVEARDDAATTICLCLVGDKGDSGIVWHIDEDVAVTEENIRATASAFGVPMRRSSPSRGQRPPSPQRSRQPPIRVPGSSSSLPA